MRTSPTASAGSSWRSIRLADRARRPTPARRCRTARHRADPTGRATARTPAWATSACWVAASSTRPGAIRPCGWAPNASAMRRNGSRSGPGDQYPPPSGTTVAATGVAASSSASAAAETDAPSPTPTIVPSRTAVRRTCARQPPDHPPGQVLGAGDRRREVRRRRGRSCAGARRRPGSRRSSSRRSGSRRCPRRGRA